MYALSLRLVVTNSTPEFPLFAKISSVPLFLLFPKSRLFGSPIFRLRCPNKPAGASHFSLGFIEGGVQAWWNVTGNYNVARPLPHQNIFRKENISCCVSNISNFSNGKIYRIRLANISRKAEPCLFCCVKWWGLWAGTETRPYGRPFLFCEMGEVGSTPSEFWFSTKTHLPQ